MCLTRPDIEMAGRLEALAEVDPEDYIAYVCYGIALWIRDDYKDMLREFTHNRAVLKQLFEYSPIVRNGS